MFKLFIVRHGETDWNVEGRIQGWTDVPLNATGLAQARLLADRLGQESGYTALYGSPLRRAWETAEIIGQAVGLEPIPEPRLKERCLGEMEGLNMPEIKERYPDLYRRWRSGNLHEPFPGEEQPEVFRGRVQGLLQELGSQRTDGRVILVTHGGTLGMIMATIMQLDLNRHFPFWFDNACINVIRYDERGPRVSALNDTCHLRDHERPRTDEQELALNDKIEDDSAGLGELAR